MKQRCVPEHPGSLKKIRRSLESVVHLTGALHFKPEGDNSTSVMKGRSV